MANKTNQLPSFGKTDPTDHVSETAIATHRFTEAALVKHKREGLVLALRARWIALAVLAVMLPLLNPRIEVLYHEFLLLLLALNGYLQWRFGAIGRNRVEPFLLFFDLLIMTLGVGLPNPFTTSEWPDATLFRFNNFIFFYIILAGATLMYSWRTIVTVGTWTAILWISAAICVWVWGNNEPELTQTVTEALGTEKGYHILLDPNAVQFDIRFKEIVVFLIVSATLAISVQRFYRLILGNAELERERANLSRYFSPNVVDELSQRDEALGTVREQNAAVLFIDLIGFTSFAAERSAREVINTLRIFHGRMEACVFRNEGTLDKYLGDGLMATFGTPLAGKNDVARALACASDMLEAVEDLNAQRRASGEEELRAGIGVHFGPVVVGDIGSNRLEFAVIGNTVNVASRMEGLTRPLRQRLILSDEAFAEAQKQGADVEGFKPVADQTIRGIKGNVTVWALS
ncbi:adenylate/guanylate cyclase domain-containing protein [Tateyamaria sp. Alg231-49]|uniref:adenylate/guanylate cyclase domain-containing protein n=1 Tax=Tateyamaria sp. Alg231-49 TaxID=1922219 RepID=UPI000D55F818|nr:adenylate/guanylate cyclase domain-containing protein [Tateyamaria sp. Alg231-49]